jgi:hypothetical protein
MPYEGEDYQIFKLSDYQTGWDDEFGDQGVTA